MAGVGQYNPLFRQRFFFLKLRGSPFWMVFREIKANQPTLKRSMTNNPINIIEQPSSFLQRPGSFRDLFSAIPPQPFDSWREQGASDNGRISKTKWLPLHLEAERRVKHQMTAACLRLRSTKSNATELFVCILCKCSANVACYVA